MDKDEQADAQTLYNVTQALTMAMGSNIISAESAVNYLAGYISTMKEWEGKNGEAGEKERIEESKMLNQPIEEAFSQQQQEKEIDDELNRGGSE